MWRSPRAGWLRRLTLVPPTTPTRIGGPVLRILATRTTFRMLTRMATSTTTTTTLAMLGASPPIPPSFLITKRLVSKIFTEHLNYGGRGCGRAVSRKLKDFFSHSFNF